MTKPFRAGQRRRLAEWAAKGAGFHSLAALLPVVTPSSEKRLVIDPDTGLPPIPKGRSSHPHIKAYIKAHGPVPPGHAVHHRDFNYRNNNPDNLVAMSFEEHRTLHGGRASLKGAARRLLRASLLDRLSSSC